VDEAFDHHRRVSDVFRATCIYQYVWPHFTPEAQADFLVDTVLSCGLQQHEMVCLDIETEAKIPDPLGFAMRWLNEVEERLDTRAWVYVPGPLSKHFHRSITDDRIIMAPKYSGTPMMGARPTWPHDIHQYTDRGFFPGCTQSGDLSHTEMTIGQLLARCNPYGVPNNACRS
jgi:GH25 family lysozyme M1 (1,4-beta-N-acetylmuramidase)